MKLNKKQQEDRKRIVEDVTQPLEKRKKAHEEIVNDFMNPKEHFDPETFDVYDNTPGYDVRRRPRMKPPRRLPTNGMHPKKLLEGQRIGEFESKQDLYLLIAELSERVADLEDKIVYNT